MRDWTLLILRFAGKIKKKMFAIVVVHQNLPWQYMKTQIVITCDMNIVSFCHNQD